MDLKEKLFKLLNSEGEPSLNFNLAQEIIKGNPLLQDFFNDWVDQKANEFMQSNLFKLLTYEDGDGFYLNNYYLNNADFKHLRDNVYDSNNKHCKVEDNPLCALQGQRHRLCGYSVNLIEKKVKLLFHIKAWGETFKVDLGAFKEDFFIGFRLKNDVR